MSMIQKGFREHEAWSLYETRLRELFAKSPYMEIKAVQREPFILNEIARPDMLIEARVGEKSVYLIGEVKNSAQPRLAKLAVLEINEWLRRFTNNVRAYGVLLAPFISKEAAKICVDAGIGYVDLSGNAHLAFESVFIHTESAQNLFKEKRVNRSLFAPRATRALRALLQGPLRPWKLKELSSAANVSLGLVSGIRTQLLEREWASEEPNGIKIIKPREVLDAWVEADDKKRRMDIHEYSSLLGGDPLELAYELDKSLASTPHAFTQWIAGWLRRPYTMPVIVSAYVKSVPDKEIIEQKLHARRVSSGGNIRLIIPKDEGVFDFEQIIKGLKLVSDVQIYLDLVKAGLRGDDQAKALAESPDFSGGWNA